MLLKGFGLSGYRSIGDELVKVAPLKKVNLIIGKNNAGKSNIIKFLSQQYSYFVSQARGQRNLGREANVAFNEIDRHISNTRASHRIAFPIMKEDVAGYINEKLPDERKHRRNRELARKLLTSDIFSDEDEITWFIYKSDRHNGEFKLEVEVEDVISVLEPRDWQTLWSTLRGKSGGELRTHWIPEAISALSFVPSSVPDVEFIPAIRQIGSAGSEASDYSGEGIIDRLAKIQNPALSDQKLKEQFTAINMFVQEVLENSSATIEIPYERDMILVHMDRKTLPLDSLGTGVHEVVILAAASTLLDKTILCVEEPELHLHPLLQRKLVRYLSEETNNQYFFTTHSAHLLDAVEAEIFHVTQNNGISLVDAISSTKQRSNICNDLGYKASDILQANCIIWVEGPSDRIYLNYWLNHKRPDLIEGVHYSIMFYGGRLFSHLTAMDSDEAQEKIDDFVSVRKLNRNSVIMFDSDKESSRARINQTKQRLKREFNEGPGFAWITEGREVENYLNHEKVEESVLAVHPSASHLLGKGQWANLLKYVKKRSHDQRTASKVKVARHYAENNKPDLNILDLDKRINALCDFISQVNSNEI